MQIWNLRSTCRRGKGYQILFIVLLLPAILFAQRNKPDSLQQATIDNCIHYALEHNPD